MGVYRGPWELCYGKDRLLFQDICHYPEDAADGNPYNTTCRVRVVSGGFSGTSEWEFDWKEVSRFAMELEQLYHFQRQEVEFQDIGYGSTVKLTMQKTGQLTVSGLLYGEALIQTLTFEFHADQTALSPFLQQLKQGCNLTDEGAING